ncbi:uncharacterized protein EI90DRAFT_3014727 [Cantharellus anzutake]|uniref:uncharacterized protein n=1 Tax=Cantharellus anzutake TaxID=1750568 RepID=UPI001907AA53|nr:uncharacterized protein EI90DRAFT_3014727 [Cantharellus anzutake]KAF8334870.1 hypothetical protein EI90DRAFT_3014727 [Cantharellus anzutake]
MSASSTPGPSNQDPTMLNLEVLLNLLQQQMVQHQDLMTAIQAQQQDQQTLMNMVQMQLQNAMPAPAPAPAVVTTSHPTVKFPNPMAFTGKPSGVCSYIAEIESCFTLYLNQFNTNYAKTMYFGTWLKNETVMKWFMGVTCTDATLLSDFTHLKEAIEKHFGDVDYVETTHCKL